MLTVLFLLQWTRSPPWISLLGVTVSDTSTVVSRVSEFPALHIFARVLMIYGLRFAVFMQGIDKDGNQTEIPDPWLTGSNPWEVGK